MSETLSTPKLRDCRDAFTATLERLAERDQKIVAVCNDSVGSSKLVAFKARWPERLINVGIAEQDMVGVGAGLANGGLLPFVCGAAPFLTGRALEQIKADIAYSNANVKLVGISWHGLWRAWADAPLDRGFRLDPRVAEPAGDRALRLD